MEEQTLDEIENEGHWSSVEPERYTTLVFMRGTSKRVRNNDQMPQTIMYDLFHGGGRIKASFFFYPTKQRNNCPLSGNFSASEGFTMKKKEYILSERGSNSRHLFLNPHPSKQVKSSQDASKVSLTFTFGSLRAKLT